MPFPSSLACANDLSLAAGVGVDISVGPGCTGIARNSARTSECVREARWQQKHELCRYSAPVRRPKKRRRDREGEREKSRRTRLGARPGRTEPISLSIPLYHARDGHLYKLDRDRRQYRPSAETSIFRPSVGESDGDGTRKDSQLSAGHARPSDTSMHVIEHEPRAEGSLFSE